MKQPRSFTDCHARAQALETESRAPVKWAVEMLLLTWLCRTSHSAALCCICSCVLHPLFCSTWKALLHRVRAFIMRLKVWSSSKAASYLLCKVHLLQRPGRRGIRKHFVWRAFWSGLLQCHEVSVYVGVDCKEHWRRLRAFGVQVSPEGNDPLHLPRFMAFWVCEEQIK